MTDPDGRQRSGWLWIWLILFAIAVLLILIWAWPTREPPTAPPAQGVAAQILAASSGAVSAARLDRL